MAQVYVAKPQKVHAEQFHTGTLPWPAAVCTEQTPVGVCAQTPLFPDWPPHVHGDGALSVLVDGEWITTSVAFPDHPPTVLTNDQFVELYGPGGGPAEGG